MINELYRLRSLIYVLYCIIKEHIYSYNTTLQIEESIMKAKVYNTTLQIQELTATAPLWTIRRRINNESSTFCLYVHYLFICFISNWIGK